jgi:hypothetical protein
MSRKNTLVADDSETGAEQPDLLSTGIPMPPTDGFEARGMPAQRIAPATPANRSTVQRCGKMIENLIEKQSVTQP